MAILFKQSELHWVNSHFRIGDLADSAPFGCADKVLRRLERWATIVLLVAGLLCCGIAVWLVVLGLRGRRNTRVDPMRHSMRREKRNTAGPLPLAVEPDRNDSASSRNRSGDGVGRLRNGTRYARLTTARAHELLIATEPMCTVLKN